MGAICDTAELRESKSGLLAPEGFYYAHEDGRASR